MKAVVQVRNFTRGNAYRKLIQEAVAAGLRAAGMRKRAEVSVALVGTSAIRSLNRKWRKKDRATDVLSFGLWNLESGSRQGGEIVICLPYARRQARELGISFRENLATLAAHGAAHLAGIDHERSAREYAKTMAIQRRVWRTISHT